MKQRLKFSKQQVGNNYFKWKFNRKSDTFERSNTPALLIYTEKCNKIMDIYHERERPCRVKGKTHICIATKDIARGSISDNEPIHCDKRKKI